MAGSAVLGKDLGAGHRRVGVGRERVGARAIFGRNFLQPLAITSGGEKGSGQSERLRSRWLEDVVSRLTSKLR
jgi:hypothetical protein